MYASLVLLMTSVALAFVYWYPVEKPGESGQYTALIEQGIALYNQGKHGEALRKLEEIPETPDKDWRIPYYTGAAQIMLGDYQQAVTSLEQALTLNNQDAGILYALGVVYYKQGNLKLAKAYFVSVLEINPADEGARGLVDIISKLERRMSDESTSVPEQENDDS